MHGNVVLIFRVHFGGHADAAVAFAHHGVVGVDEKIQEDFLQALEIAAHQRHASRNIEINFRAGEVVEISLSESGLL